MSDIRIGPTAQATIGGAILLGIAAAIVAQLPELQRYLKVRKM
jgi:hypothetical protein